MFTNATMDLRRLTAIIAFLLTFYVLLSSEGTTRISGLSSSETTNNDATTPHTTESTNIDDTLASFQSTKDVTILTNSETTWTDRSSSVSGNTETSLSSSEITERFTLLSNSESPSTITSVPISESTENVTSVPSFESTNTGTALLTSESISAATTLLSSESPSTATKHVSLESTSTATTHFSSESASAATTYLSSESTSNVTAQFNSESPSTETAHFSSESTSTETAHFSSESTSTETAHFSSESTSTETAHFSPESTSATTTYLTSKITSAATFLPSSESQNTTTAPPNSEDWVGIVIGILVAVLVVVVIFLIALWFSRRRTKGEKKSDTETGQPNPEEQIPFLSRNDLSSETELITSQSSRLDSLEAQDATKDDRIRLTDNPNFSDRSFRRGLRNLGNTCYFNAAIQCLTSTPILKSQLLDITDKNELTAKFLKFLCSISPEDGSSSTELDPKPLLNGFCAKVARFRGRQQQDSHELLRHFLDQLRLEERAVYPNEKLTAVDKVFGGHFMTIYICQNCRTPYHVCEPFLDISVPICSGEVPMSETETKSSTPYPEAAESITSQNVEECQAETSDTESALGITKVKSSKRYQEAAESVMERLSPESAYFPPEVLSITDSLQYFTRQELLGEQYLCTSCAYDSSFTSPYPYQDIKLTSATKQTLIFNPPAVLVIHLKRFEIKSSGSEKRSNKVKFGEVLDLAPYCSSWCQRNELRAQNIWYTLYAVVVHSGTLSSGHYVAYVKERNESGGIARHLQKEYLDKDMTAVQLVEMIDSMKRKGGTTISTKAIASEGNWYCVNDSRVSKIAVNDVLRQEAYLLFYERVSTRELLD